MNSPTTPKLSGGLPNRNLSAPCFAADPPPALAVFLAKYYPLDRNTKFPTIEFEADCCTRKVKPDGSLKFTGSDGP